MYHQKTVDSFETLYGEYIGRPIGGKTVSPGAKEKEKRLDHNERISTAATVVSVVDQTSDQISESIAPDDSEDVFIAKISNRFNLGKI